MKLLLGSAHAFAARSLVLEEAGVPYESARIDLATGEHKSADYRAINPMAKVPALTDGSAAVAESGAICAYVAEVDPEAGLAPPLGDPARARYLRWLFFSPGCIEQAFLVKSFNIPVRPESAGFGAFDRVFDVLEAAVDMGPWLLGELFSAADVMIGSDLHFGIDIFCSFAARAARLCGPMPCTAGAPARQGNRDRRRLKRSKSRNKMSSKTTCPRAALARRRSITAQC
jgi:glutathione S-transferase